MTVRRRTIPLVLVAAGATLALTGCGGGSDSGATGPSSAAASPGTATATPGSGGSGAAKGSGGTGSSTASNSSGTAGTGTNGKAACGLSSYYPVVDLGSKNAADRSHDIHPQVPGGLGGAPAVPVHAGRTVYAVLDTDPNGAKGSNGGFDELGLWTVHLEGPSPAGRATPRTDGVVRQVDGRIDSAWWKTSRGSQRALTCCRRG